MTLFFHTQVNFHQSSPRAARLILPALLVVAALFAQVQAQETAAVPQPTIETITIDEPTESDVFAFNKNILIKGAAAKGVMAFGGDVIVEGRVAGDVAAFGGSVMQKPDSFIGGDVLVFGGSYHHGKQAPLRNPQSHTVIYAGFGEELREIAKNPLSLAAPELTATYFALRILTVLFWFAVSLALTTVAPNAVSRAVTRLKLTGLRLALIGVLATVVCAVGVEIGLTVLPQPFSVVVGLMTVVLLFLAYIFGRVCVHAATGKFLQKIIFADKSRSESVALLLGAIFWTTILSIPFVWTAVFIGIFVISFGMILTARPNFGR